LSWLPIKALDFLRFFPKRKESTLKFSKLCKKFPKG
jgi:hypothetical protein